MGDTARPEEYGKALDLLLQDPGTHGVLVIHAPASVNRSLDCAQAVVARAAKSRRLVMTCWLGEASVDSARDCF
jgi:acetyltransferase